MPVSVIFNDSDAAMKSVCALSSPLTPHAPCVLMNLVLLLTAGGCQVEIVLSQKFVNQSSSLDLESVAEGALGPIQRPSSSPAIRVLASILRVLLQPSCLRKSPFNSSKVSLMSEAFNLLCGRCAETSCMSLNFTATYLDGHPAKLLIARLIVQHNRWATKSSTYSGGSKKWCVACLECQDLISLLGSNVSLSLSLQSYMNTPHQGGGALRWCSLSRSQLRHTCSRMPCKPTT